MGPALHAVVPPNSRARFRYPAGPLGRHAARHWPEATGSASKSAGKKKQRTFGGFDDAELNFDSSTIPVACDARPSGDGSGQDMAASRSQVEGFRGSPASSAFLL